VLLVVPKEADSNRPLIIDSIVIQSPHLKRILSEIFSGYPGLETNVSRLIFAAPFECFVHCWESFVKAKEAQTDEDAKQHMDLLFRIMSEELSDELAQLEDSLKNHTVKWQHVWTIFTPGSSILTNIGGAPAAVRVESGSYVETQCGPIFALKCILVDWDGKRLGWAKNRQSIPCYDGTIPFWSLPCCPLEYCADAEEIKAALVARGRVFESLIGAPNYKYYEGSAMYWPESRFSSQNERQWESVSSRIVLDGEGWKKFNSNYAKPVESFGGRKSKSSGVTVASRAARDDPKDYENLSIPADRAPLAYDELLLSSPIIRGYCLKLKKWMEFSVSDVSDITFDTTAFESLVLDGSRKELILAFAESHAQHNNFDDIITGKGRGVIMMLSGSPGTGKTLTAESVAEKMQVPLYILSSSDLGTSAQKVELLLNEILGMVARWNAVLLLDECDIFLEQRTTHDLERNRVVGTFLRVLEYYKGLLFLTTNRATSIDPAFHSRIHLSLEYSDLDSAARKVIWASFINKLASESEARKIGDAGSVTDEELGRLSGLQLNGRQIKNVFKMAHLLASNKKQSVKFEHIELVLKAEGYSL
jgi:hypothetical protein